MYFEWDETKNLSNQKKHKISFETATLVFDDPHAVSMLESIEDGEERWHTIGLAAGVVMILVVHTYRDTAGRELVRIISARKATPRERKIYEENL